MKEMNSLEMRLRCWEPRPPSENLRQRLFPPHARATPFPLTLRWLAPALTCALLGAVIIRQESGLPTGGARLEPVTTVVWSNQTSSTSLSNDIERAGSNLPAGSFEWTNSRNSTSSIGSFLPVKLN